MSFSPEEEKALDEARQKLTAGEFAFVDGGCGIGGSLAYCEKTFDRGRGIGFDLSPNKIAGAREAGHNVYRADMSTIALPEKSVSFVTFLDVLEHLPNVEVTRSILENMARVAKDFIFIRHPSFEDIDYLRDHGLKITWTDWHGHPNMMTLDDFDLVFRDLGWSAPTVYAQKPIADSTHPKIVPFSAPTDSVHYDADAHGPKKEVTFDRPIYSQFDIFVALNRDFCEDDWRAMTLRVIEARNRPKLLDSLGVD